jgi:L-lactate dehydrogenase/malate dehydrogenase
MPRTCVIKSPYVAKFKVGIVGCGNVGATAAYAMLIEGTPSEIVLYDLDYNKARGLELDYEHSLSFVDYTKVTSTENIEGLQDCDMIVITAGARQKEGETRLDLIANKVLLSV